MIAVDGSDDTLWAMSTSIQSHVHKRAAYLRNACKRLRLSTAISAVMMLDLSDWTIAAEQMMTQVLRHGGVLQLWGHSWEIEEHDQWEALQRILSILGERVKSGELQSMTNQDVCIRQGLPSQYQ